MTTDISELISQMSSERFYGSLEIKFEAGRVVLLKKTETVKPTEPGYTKAFNSKSSKLSEITNDKLKSR